MKSIAEKSGDENLSATLIQSLASLQGPTVGFLAQLSVCKGLKINRRDSCAHRH